MSGGDGTHRILTGVWPLSVEPRPKEGPHGPFPRASMKLYSGASRGPHSPATSWRDGVDAEVPDQAQVVVHVLQAAQHLRAGAEGWSAAWQAGPRESSLPGAQGPKPVD